MKILGIIKSLLGASMLASAFVLVGCGIAQATSNRSEATATTSGLMVSAEAANSYAEECAVCHMAYPAELLPARSWMVLLSQLDDHFGEYAVLENDIRDEILTYLQANAGDVKGGKLMRRLQSDRTPLRITELPAHYKIHGEIPDYMVTGNPEVGSLSQCQACHGSRAEEGYFDEHKVKIPGYEHYHD